MENGDLIIKYKEEQSINTEIDQKIEKFLKTLGFKWMGSGFSFHENIRDIAFVRR